MSGISREERQRLRELAENANVEYPTKGTYEEKRAVWDAYSDYEHAATPSTLLALLDELDKTECEREELCSHIESALGEVRAVRFRDAEATLILALSLPSEGV